MGPRSADRGNAGTGDVDLDKYKLQWGRDQLIAEIPGAAGTRAPSPQLQWGRDQLIAEIIVAVTNVSFCVSSLQWGRDQLIAEILPAVEAWKMPLSFNWGAIRWSPEIVICCATLSASD